MKKILLLLAFAFVFSPISAQKSLPWKKIGHEKANGFEKIRVESYSQDQQLLEFNLQVFKQSLVGVKDKSSGLQGVEVIVPNRNGDLERFTVWENSNFEPELQAQFPEIRSFVGRGITDPAARLDFSLSPNGIQTMIFRGDSTTEFIEPYTKDGSVYVGFNSKTRNKGSLPFNCSTTDIAINQELLNASQLAGRANNQVYKTMRLALSCTGEYAQYHGGTVAGALAAINATMTRVNGVMERDLALKLNLISNNTSIIYTNASTDPYSPASSMSNWNNQLQTTLTSVIGEANYDIGHLFGASGGGGNAGCIGCVCNTGKGSAYSSPSDGIPMGDKFDIDYVVHEMGHQLGANHTFSHSSENNSVNVEPGSGSTVMAYAGITGATDVQPNSDAYFTYRSILQIQTNLATKSCPVSTTISANTAPVVNAGGNFTIPKSTPFILEGTASDANGDVLTYCWEQNDDATTVGASSSYPSGTKTQGPNFRSFMPNTSLVRYMPALSTVLGGSLSSTWEATSTVGRTLNFTFTARDSNPAGPQTNTASSVVTVSNSHGPFDVTSQSASGIVWTQNTSETITWTVNNTDSMAGAANVNILLSIDGGLTYPIVLKANTPNDGAEVITVPNVAAQFCRVMVRPTGNIFYDINSKAFSIGYSCNVNTASPNSAIADGLGANSPGAITTSTINVPNNVSVNNLKVMFNTNHTWIGDLVVKLSHPDGTQVTLWNRTCNNPQRQGIDITFMDGASAPVCASPTSGNGSPSQPLSVLNGKMSAGIWTLTAQDFYNGDTGNIVSWGLDFGCSLANTVFNSGTDFKVYPNPNNGIFNVQYNSQSNNDIKVYVHDIGGREIFVKSYKNFGTFNENLQLNNVQAGIYMLTVIDGERKEVKKIIIE